MSTKKSKKLFRAIGEIDDKMLLKADQIQIGSKKKKSGYFWFYGIAACIAAAAGIGVYQTQFSGSIVSPPSSSGETGISVSGSQAPSISSEIPSVNELPTITPWQTYQFRGEGFEGYVLTDISELKSAAPWTEDAELKTLPVFHNVYATTAQYPEDIRKREHLPLLEGKRATVEEMEALARSIADGFGVAVESVKVDPTEEYLAAVKEKLEKVGDALSEEDTLPTRVTLICSGDIEIMADTTLEARIEFKTPVSLPAEYQFNDHSSYEEMAAAGEYLVKEYERLLHMEKPVLNVTGGDRNIYGEQSFTCYVYEGAGDLTQQMLNYHFNTVRFSPDDDGKLWLIDFTNYDLSEKLGDYPILTLEDARSKLIEGKYITSSSTKFPGQEYIAKSELIYMGSGDITIMPYYRFYVDISMDETWKLPDIDNNAVIPEGKTLKRYTAYYVPAVQEEYIKDMLAWDGNFNS